MPVALFPSWGRPLRERGWFAATLEDLEPFEQNFLRNLSTTSILLLAVPGKAAVPGFLAFEQATPRHWQNDEINILRLAADAVANTLVRQDLLEQLQASLDETENLYHLSTRMSTAATLQEMVAVIPQGMRIPAINALCYCSKRVIHHRGKSICAWWPIGIVAAAPHHHPLIRFMELTTLTIT